ncbi:hypothetical protein [Streptomyces cyaneofuscatus]|uniref:hypothetical protein n=1 Tax=Streptomyces cyaneofuscatus TaxID=66883 RepID=UPI002E10DBA0|nr:hypothetical protein OG366_01335 [Streptomyces cyaneofuscatus]WTF39696.1 hypothetical protein OG973_35215 [Streptomyces cyaneofuscatus]
MTQTPNDNDRTGGTANRATPSTGAERVPPVTPPGDPLGTPVPASAAKPATSPETAPGNRPDGASVPASGTPRADEAHATSARTEGARETGRTTGAASSSRSGTATGTATGATPDTGRDAAAGKDRPLFSTEQREKFDARIHQAVAGFVENPRQAVQEADAAFDEVVAGLTKALADRSRLLRADRDGERSDAETEDLRIALQQYRDLTERLVRL